MMSGDIQDDIGDDDLARAAEERQEHLLAEIERLRHESRRGRKALWVVPLALAGALFVYIASLLFFALFSHAFLGSWAEEWIREGNWGQRIVLWLMWSIVPLILATYSYRGTIAVYFPEEVVNRRKIETLRRLLLRAASED
jgi:4-amino-4-deoxy-L-arabinose transferase-like glycosyltransferase